MTEQAQHVRQVNVVAYLAVQLNGFLPMGKPGRLIVVTPAQIIVRIRLPPGVTQRLSQCQRLLTHFMRGLSLVLELKNVFEKDQSIHFTLLVFRPARQGQAFVCDPVRFIEFLKPCQQPAIGKQDLRTGAWMIFGFWFLNKRFQPALPLRQVDTLPVTHQPAG